VRTAVERVVATATAKGLSRAAITAKVGAKLNGVSTNTVREVLEDLADEGLVNRPVDRGGWTAGGSNDRSDQVIDQIDS